MSTYSLPSVVEISGAGGNVESSLTRKDFKIKIKQSAKISNGVKTFVTFCSGYLFNCKINAPLL